MTTASPPTIAGGRALRIGGQIAAWTGAAIVLAVLIWSAIVSGGAPDPTALDSPSTVKALDIAVLVFREGLECILVLAAITASMKGSTQSYQRPVAVGAALAFAATLITWFAVVGMVDALSGRLVDIRADNISAAGHELASHGSAQTGPCASHQKNMVLNLHIPLPYSQSIDRTRTA